MKTFTSVSQLEESLKGAASLNSQNQWEFNVPVMFRGEMMDRLVWNAVLSPDQGCRDTAAHVIRSAANNHGIWLDTIQPLYAHMIRYDKHRFTVPAFNVRGLTYEVCRAVFRAARKARTGPFIFELAPSEMGYSGQTPNEYAVCVLAAALRERYQGPVFLQGDHYKLDTTEFAESPEKAKDKLKALISESLDAGFYNLDIDCSNLSIGDGQIVESNIFLNADTTSEMFQYAMSKKPKSVQINLGAEIGEIGCTSTQSDEIDLFMDRISGMGPFKGFTKLSVGVGTRRGGVVDSEGTIQSLEVDLEQLKTLSKLVQSQWKLAGTVLHGASTLPETTIHGVTETGCVEIHLGTGIQNAIIDHTSFPTGLREDMYSYLRTQHPEAQLPEWSETQFYYYLRKKIWAPFRKAIWSLDDRAQAVICNSLESRFLYYFKELGLESTHALIQKLYKNRAEKMLKLGMPK